jgi:hypothetical protein
VHRIVLDDVCAISLASTSTIYRRLRTVVARLLVLAAAVVVVVATSSAHTRTSVSAARVRVARAVTTMTTHGTTMMPMMAKRCVCVRMLVCTAHECACVRACV